MPITLVFQKLLSFCISIYGGPGCVSLLVSTLPVLAYVHRLNITQDLLMVCYHLYLFLIACSLVGQLIL